MKCNGTGLWEYCDVSIATQYAASVRRIQEYAATVRGQAQKLWSLILTEAGGDETVFPVLYMLRTFYYSDKIDDKNNILI